MVHSVRRAQARVHRSHRIYTHSRRDAAAGNESERGQTDQIPALVRANAGGILRTTSVSPSTPWIGACLAAPAIATALTLTAVESLRLADPEAPLLGGPPPATLAQSIIEGFGVEQTVQFIRRGQDPNEPVPVGDAEYTGGGTVHVSPLMLAVAAGDGSAMRML